MHANLVLHTNAFAMHLNPQYHEVEVTQSVYDVLFHRGYFKHSAGKLVRNGAFLVLYNGEPLLQRDWNTMLAPEDVIQVVHLPRGGGNSSLGNILGAILAAVMAYFTFGMSLYASIAIGAVAYVGLSLIGAPPPTASLGSLGRDKQSPTYSLNAQSNEARLLEAIPRVYGRMRVWPDLASQPYGEYKGNEQYLYQLFSVSLGDVDIEKVFVEDNDLDSFEEAEYQVIKPGQAVTLFPDNVVTSSAVSGLSMYGPDHEDYLELGPFIASPSGTRANYIGIDLSMPRGLGTVDNKGNTQNRSVVFVFDWQEVDNNGTPVAGWNTLVQETVTMATTDAQMLSYKVAIPNKRVRIRGRRVSAEPTDTRAFDTISWVGLRAYLESTFIYPDVTLIAVAMRATNTLNSQTARKFSVIAKSLLQSWDPVNGYSSAAFTQNPAWIAMDILRNQNYGRGLETSRFNIQELYRLSQVYVSRNDTFNGTFDTTTQLWDALTKVLRVGRTTPMPYGGVIDFIRDEPRTVPTAMFQPSNIVSGSFKTDYSFFTHETPDHVIVEYIDPTKWEVATVECKLPGEPSDRPKTVELFGCTDRDQAWREGMYLAAANRDRRRQITFTTTKAGLIPYYNSLVRVAHDVPQWGYFGRVLSLNPTNGRLRTTEPIVFDGSPQHVIAFRKRDGSEDGPYVMTPDASLPDGEYGCFVQGSVQQRSLIYVSDGIREDLTYYQCGPTQREGLRALLQSAKPNQDGTVALTLMNYADSVHAAENGGVIPPPPPASNLPITPSAPIVDYVEVFYTTTVGVQNIVASPANGAIYYEFRAMDILSPNGQVWQNLGTSDKPSLQSHLSASTWRVQCRAVGRAVGPWATWEGPILWTSLPTAKLDLFTAVSKLFAVGLNWSYAAESLSICERVHIRFGVTNILGNSQLLVELPYPANAYDHTDLAAGQSFFYWARVIDTAGREGPWFNSGVGIQAGASTDAVKILNFLTGKITESQLGQALLNKIESADVDLTGVYAEIEEVRQQSIDGDNAQTSQINNAVSVAGNAASLAQQAVTTSATADGKATTAITNSATAVTNAGNAQATAQTALTATATTNNSLAAMYTIKTQLTVGGVPYLAGLGVGVENNNGIVTSQILLAADRVAVLNTANGQTVSPFTIQGGQTFINEAIIGTLSANKINVGFGGNQLANSTLVTTQGWATYDGIGSCAFGINLGGMNGDWTLVNENFLYIYQPNNWFNGSTSPASVYFTDIPCQGGKKYELSMYTGAHRCTAFLSVEFYNAAGTYVGHTTFDGDNANARELAGGRNLDNYKRIFIRATSHPTATKARLLIGKLPTVSGEADSYIFAGRPMFAPVHANQTVLTEYQPTGQGVVITPSGISAANVSAITGNFGLMRTTGSGGRMEIADNVGRVYDTSNVLRLKWGNLDL